MANSLRVRAKLQQLPVDEVAGKARERTENCSRRHDRHICRIGQGAELRQFCELQVGHAAMQDGVDQLPAGRNENRAVTARRRLRAAPVQVELRMRRLGQRHVNMREQFREPGVDPASRGQAAPPGDRVGGVRCVFLLDLEPFVTGVRDAGFQNKQVGASSPPFPVTRRAVGRGGRARRSKTTRDAAPLRRARPSARRHRAGCATDPPARSRPRRTGRRNTPDSPGAARLRR